MTIFSKRIEQFFTENDQKAFAPIDKMSLPTEDKISEAAGRVASLNKISTVSIQPKGTTTKVLINQVSNKQLNPYHHFNEHKSYPRAAVSYLIPIKGNIPLLECSPRTSTGYGSNAVVYGNNLKLEIQTEYATVDLSPDVEEFVKRAVLVELERVQANIENINKEVEEYNEQLQGRLHVAIQERIAAEKEKKDRENRLNPFA